MKRWASAALAASASFAFGVGLQAAAPPDAKLTVQAFLGLSADRQADYAAGVADGLAMGAFQSTERMRELLWCMNGYAPSEIAELVGRRGGEFAGRGAESYAGAQLIGIVMARECQLQQPPR